jgi:hypothetical protein
MSHMCFPLHWVADFCIETIRLWFVQYGVHLRIKRPPNTLYPLSAGYSESHSANFGNFLGD